MPGKSIDYRERDAQCSIQRNIAVQSIEQLAELPCARAYADEYSCWTYSDSHCHFDRHRNGDSDGRPDANAHSHAGRKSDLRELVARLRKAGCCRESWKLQLFGIGLGTAGHFVSQRVGE